MDQNKLERPSVEGSCGSSRRTRPGGGTPVALRLTFVFCKYGSSLNEDPFHGPFFYKGAVPYWDLRRGPNLENYPNMVLKVFESKILKPSLS